MSPSDLILASGSQLPLLPLDKLIEYLKASTHRTRVDALRGLERMGVAAAAAAPQVEKLLKEKDREIRFYAVRVLGSIGPAAAAAAPALAETLKDEYDNVRYSAADALWKIGPAAVAAAPALAEALTDTDFDVRRAAAEALGKMPAAAACAVPALAGALADEFDSVRMNAADALAEIALSAKKSLAIQDNSELKMMLVLWQNAQKILDAVDSANGHHGYAFDTEKSAVRRLVKALQKAQAGNSAAGSSD